MSDVLSAASIFRFQLLNIVRVSAVHTIFGVAPKKIIAAIHIRWTRCPRTLTPQTFCKSLQQHTAIKHIIAGRPGRHSFHVRVYRPAGKMCRHTLLRE